MAQYERGTAKPRPGSHMTQRLFARLKSKMAARSGISGGAKGRLISVIGDEVS